MVLQAKMKHIKNASHSSQGNHRDQNLTKKKGQKKGSCHPKHKIDIGQCPKNIKKFIMINGKKCCCCCNKLRVFCVGKLCKNSPKECKGPGHKLNKKGSTNDTVDKFNKLEVSETNAMEMDFDNDDVLM
jgi:hypothetical protein